MTSPDQDVQADTPTAPDVDPQVVPPVVIVMVVDDPGDWFEETLTSIANLQYGNASLLVIDVGDDEQVRERIGAIVPDAHHRKLESNPGFGAACNEAIRAVQGAAFLLLCHDDVRLEPAALQVLVEEAFRSNAGIVGPKLVDWAHPERLLSVGMAADKTGYPAPNVERGELDQEQHDAVRDTFYVPGAVTLVRADLFEALGGFDDGIDFHADDLDICWRAQVAGARVGRRSRRNRGTSRSAGGSTPRRRSAALADAPPTARHASLDDVVDACSVGPPDRGAGVRRGGLLPRSRSVPPGARCGWRVDVERASPR